MSDLSGMMSIAKTALNASRYALTVTSNNIANAETEGYSRQSIVLSTGNSVDTTEGYFGTGVTVEEVQRIRDTYVDQEIRTTNSDQGYYEKMNTLLDQVEAYFNEPVDDGLSTELDSFFTSFEELGANPEESGVRETVIQAGISLADTFKTLTAGIETVRASALDGVTSNVEEINTLTKEIASLNQEIFSIGQDSANDLLDTRDSKIDELSKLMSINVITDDNGLANISSAGSTLVSGVNALEIEVDSDSNTVQLKYKGTNNALGDVGGEVGANMEAFNTTLPKYTDMLDTLASTIITKVNELHSAGYGLATDTSEASTGVDFFTGTDASSIAVSEEVANDINKVAAAGTASSGDNSVAYSIANVLDEGLFDDGTTTIVEYYRSIAIQLGYENSTTLNNADASSTRVETLQNIKTSVSGVSLDDEMVSLIQYQRMYQASGKLVQTISDMYDTLMEMV
jgi:flagellar hook-associated protein 1